MSRFSGAFDLHPNAGEVHKAGSIEYTIGQWGGMIFDIPLETNGLGGVVKVSYTVRGSQGLEVFENDHIYADGMMWVLKALRFYVLEHSENTIQWVPRAGLEIQGMNGRLVRSARSEKIALGVVMCINEFFREHPEIYRENLLLRLLYRMEQLNKKSIDKRDAITKLRQEMDALDNKFREARDAFDTITQGKTEVSESSLEQILVSLGVL